MKKVISIFITSLLMLAGLNFSIATHYCHGHLVAMNASFSHESATCGMELNCNDDESTTQSIHQNCCKDEISSLTVDQNYSPAFFKIQQPEYQLLHLFYVPVKARLLSQLYPSEIIRNVFPPGDSWQPTKVGLSFICVFLI